MSQTFRRLIRNMMGTFAAKILVRAVGFVVFILQANYLGRQQFGLYFEVYSFVMILLAFIDLGWHPLIVRDVARDPLGARKRLANFLAFETLASTGFVALLIVYALAAPYGAEQTTLVCWAAVALFFGGLVKAPAAVLVGFQRADLATFIELIVNFAASVATIVAIRMNCDILAFVWILNAYFIVLFAVTQIAAARFAGGGGLVGRSFGEGGWRIDTGFWRSMIRQGILAALISGLYILYARLDIVMLSLMTEFNSRGGYAIAVKLTDPQLLFVEAIMMAVYPVLSARFASDPAGFRFLIDKSLKAMLALGLPVALGLALLGPGIINVLFPDAEFAGTHRTLQIIVWRLPLLFAYAPINFALLASGRLKTLLAINLSGVIANLLLNLALIPVWKENGAAAATIVCHGGVLGFYCLFRSRFYNFKISLPDMFRLIAALTAMAAALIAAQTWFGVSGGLVDLLVRIAIGAIIYFAALLLGGFIGKDERPYLLQEWRRYAKKEEAR